MSCHINLEADYPLNGPSIGGFEAYVFILADKFIQEHTAFDGEMILVDGKKGTVAYPMSLFTTRMEIKEEFDRLMLSKLHSFPRPDNVSCVMIDIEDNASIYDEYDIEDVYQELRTKFVNWMTSHDRVAVMVQHFYQGQRLPHVHILYEKGQVDSEFQYWLSKRFSRVN